MFSGILSVNMDAKGRFAIPTRFREGLTNAGASKITLTVDYDITHKKLVLYPLSHWEEVQEKFTPTSKSADFVSAKRLVLGHAFDDIEPDGGGRILVPPMLRSFASLEKKLVLVGQPNKVEIWPDDVWDAYMEEMTSAPIDYSNVSAELEAVPL